MIFKIFSIRTIDYLLDKFAPKILERAADSAIASIFSSLAPENTTLKDRNISFLNTRYDTCVGFRKALKGRISDLFASAAIKLLRWDAKEMSEAILDAVFSFNSNPENQAAPPANSPTIIHDSILKKEYLNATKMLINAELDSARLSLATALASGISAENWFISETGKLDENEPSDYALKFLVYAKAAALAFPEDKSIQDLLKIADDSLKLEIKKEFSIM